MQDDAEQQRISSDGIERVQPFRRGGGFVGVLHGKLDTWGESRCEFKTYRKWVARASRASDLNSGLLLYPRANIFASSFSTGFTASASRAAAASTVSPAVSTIALARA